MTTEELKDWMDERFQNQLRELKGINDRLDTTSKRLNAHENWLWFIRGAGALMVIALGFIGVKVRL